MKEEPEFTRRSEVAAARSADVLPSRGAGAAPDAEAMTRSNTRRRQQGQALAHSQPHAVQHTRPPACHNRSAQQKNLLFFKFLNGRTTCPIITDAFKKKKISHIWSISHLRSQ